MISMWRRGGQYTGKMHRIIAVIAVVASGFAYVGLTDVAIDKRVISNYFGNIAFAYEDYGSHIASQQAYLIQESISRPVTVKRRWRRSTRMDALT